jgi:hypothetical protein
MLSEAEANRLRLRQLPRRESAEALTVAESVEEILFLGRSFPWHAVALSAPNGFAKAARRTAGTQL